MIFTEKKSINDSYGKKSITIGTTNNWKKTQYQFSNLSPETYSPTKIKS